MLTGIIILALGVAFLICVGCLFYYTANDIGSWNN